MLLTDIRASYVNATQPDATVGGMVMACWRSTWLEQFTIVGDINSIKYDTMRCDAMHCTALRCDAMRCDTIQYNTMQCNAMQCNAMQCNAMQCNAMQCKAMQCKAMQCNAMQYNLLLKLSEPYSTRPSDRDQIWHACVDRYGTGSHLKNWPTPPQGCLGGYLCVWVAMMMMCDVWWCGCQLRFTDLFRGPVTLFTSTHRHYNESVYSNKQHTRGNNMIP